MITVDFSGGTPSVNLASQSVSVDVNRRGADGAPGADGYPGMESAEVQAILTDAQAAASSSAQSAASSASSAQSAADAAALVGAPAGEVIAAVAITRTPAPLTPLWVDTLDLAGSRLAAPGVRTGLPTTTHSVVAGDGTTMGQGYTTEHVATGVSGTKGAYTLTVTDTTTLTTLHGGATKPWDAAVVNGDGRALTVTVMAVSGGTITTLAALPFDITGGTLSSRIDDSFGQHLTKAGYKALAQHIAATSPLHGTRGGILDGQWDTLPASHRTPWTANAALAAYGVSNSPAPIVQTSIFAQEAGNPYDANDLHRRTNVQGGGARIGTHLAGHGGTATVSTRRRPAVVEVSTFAARDTASMTTTARIRVTATTDAGAILYDATAHGGMVTHRIPTPADAETITIEATNTDGGIYYIVVAQLIAREAGAGDRLVTKKALLLGDSWTQYGDHYLGAELASALTANVVTFGKGGMTTDWGIAWLDTALAANPGCDTVILHFYTNDLNNNQNSTMTLPSGETVAAWPNGLTTDQARARWVQQINRLASMVQARGLRPVIVCPGTVNAVTQMPAARIADSPRLVDWRATPAELADATAYVNRVGKREGVTVAVGSSTKTATGALPSDPWSNAGEEAVAGLQTLTLSLSDYSLATGALIGTDSNADGLSDGLSAASYGTTTGDTYTPSIVGGVQEWTSVYAASGASGNNRIGVTFTPVAGTEYLILFDVTGAPASASFVDSVTDLTGSVVAFGSTGTRSNRVVDATGAGVIWHRATAGTAATRYARIQMTRVNGATREFQIARVYVVDLPALFAVAPNAKAFTDAELAAYCLSLKP